jgi:hypothetical protein
MVGSDSPARPPARRVYLSKRTGEPNRDGLAVRIGVGVVDDSIGEALADPIDRL